MTHRLLRPDGRASTSVAFAFLLGTLGLPVFAVDAWQLIHHDTLDWQNRSHRVEVATDLAQRVRILTDTVPALSARKAKRVIARKQRIETDDPGARSRFFLSNDYQHWVLIQHLDGIQTALECVIEAVEIATEMACWGQASLAFGKEDEIVVALDRLRSARMMLRGEKLPVKAKDPGVWYDDFSRGIVAYIVLPYLEQKALDARERGAEQ